MISPKLVEVGRHLNIELLTNTELLDLKGNPGNFSATVYQEPRFVDLAKCTSCGECTKVCPIALPNEYDEGLSERKAIFKQYPQAIPGAFGISKRGDIYVRSLLIHGARSALRCAEGKPDRLLPYWIQAGLRCDRLGKCVYYKDTVTSTQDVAFELMVEGRPHGTIVLADHQTAGRGRSNRNWQSTPGKCLLFSLLLDLEPAAIEHIDRILLDQTRGQLPFAAARSLLGLDESPCESMLLVVLPLVRALHQDLEERERVLEPVGPEIRVDQR